MVHTRLLTSRKPPTSCATCFAWGLLPGRHCGACYSFAQNHPPGTCASCARVVPLKKDYCRLCWCQASLDARGQVSVLAPYLRQVDHHQLFFAWMQKPRQPGPRRGKRGRRQSRPRLAPPPASNPATGCVQLRLFDQRRDYTRFDRRRHAVPNNPWLLWAQHTARQVGEARGWTTWVASDVDRALVILLSGHIEGETIRYSELFPALRARGLSAGRTAEILDQIGLFDDDRVPAFEGWLDRKLADLAPGVRRDVEAWLRLLRGGGPRTRPRSAQTVFGYLTEARPALVAWSARYDHLREVTRDDVLAVASDLHGTKRLNTLVALRSLFGHCKRAGVIFRDPTRRIRIGRQEYKVAQPLRPAEIRLGDHAVGTSGPRSGRHSRRASQGHPRALARGHRSRQPAHRDLRPRPSAG